MYSEGTSVENRKPVRATRARNAGKNVRLLPTLKVLSQIELGMAREKVLSIAGNPQGRIDTGSLDEERWTYASKEGSFVKVRLEKGVVTTVQLPPSRP